MSATPKTDALFFPYGRDATAAAEPSLLVCMTQYELLERELAALRLNLSVTMEELGEMRDRAEKAEADNATLRDALSQLIEVHDAMGGMCGTARIAAEEALLGKAHREKNGG